MRNENCCAEQKSIGGSTLPRLKNIMINVTEVVNGFTIVVSGGLVEKEESYLGLDLYQQVYVAHKKSEVKEIIEEILKERMVF
jgi:hypothetical protein